MASAPKQERRTRDDWIRAAIEAVRQEGADGMRIDRLCRDLGVTKGSFYHHFKSRRQLVQAIADYWSQTQPSLVEAHLASLSGDANARLVALVQLFTELDIGARDHAMRAWGATETVIREAVSTADARVVTLLEGILGDMGLGKRERHDFARVLMFTAIGFYTAPELVDDKGRVQVVGQVLALVRGAARSSSKSRSRKR